MRVDDRMGSVDEVLSSVPEQQSLITQLHEWLLQVHPEVVVVPRPGEKSISYGFGSKKNSESYAYLIPHSKHVNLGFMFGAQLEDRDALLEGTGKNLRHIKIYEFPVVKQRLVEQLLEEARNERIDSLGL